MADFSNITSLLENVEDMAPSGFAIAFHLRLTTSELQFQTYPRKWNEIYSERGYVMSDPIVGWAFANTGVTRWSDLKSLDTLDIMGQCSEYGMKFGAAVGVESGDTRSVAGFARPDREYTDKELSTLNEYVQQLHDLTASKTGMSEDLRAELHRLSVEMTHPS